MVEFFMIEYNYKILNLINTRLIKNNGDWHIIFLAQNKKNDFIYLYSYNRSDKVKHFN